MNKKIKTSLKSLFILSAFAFSLSVLASWNDPSAPAPGANTPPPLNTSFSTQVKQGGLWLGNLFVNNHADFNSTLSTVGSVGIGTPNLTNAKLEVAGTVKITGGNPALNKVLASDAGGLASWKTLAELGGSGGGGGGGNVSNNNINGTLNYITKWINGNNIGNSQIFDNGTNVGIGMFAPTAKLEVAGQVKITGGNPGPNKILTSDPAGLASWKTPTEIGIPTGGGGNSSGFSTSWSVASCSLNLGAGTLNTVNGIYSHHFTVPPSMNGWKIAGYHASACDGDGDISITPQIKKSNGTLQNLTTITVQAWNLPGEWIGSQTVNTGDRIRIGNWTNSGTLNGLSFSLRLKP